VVKFSQTYIKEPLEIKRGIKGIEKKEGEKTSKFVPGEDD
jgi:hypothetical protein